MTDNVGDKTGPINNGDKTDDTQPEFNGKGEAGDVIAIIDNGEVIGTAIVDDNGNWSWTPEAPLAEGEHSITIVETDEAGNSSQPSAPVAFEVDTTAPATPAAPAITDNVGDKTGPINNGDKTDDNQPEFNGKGEAGDVIAIIDNGTVIGSTVVDDNGNWSWTPEAPLAEGEHSITIVETDEAGNASQPSAPVVFEVDTTAPATPAAPAITDNVGDKTGPINNGDKTDDTQPEFNGKGEAGDVISIIDNGEVIGTAIVDDNGNWSWTPEAPLAEGEHSITIVETDEAGNLSEKSADFVLTMDFSAPGTVTDLTITDNVGAVTGALKDGDTTDDATPTFSGKAEADSIVTVYDGETAIGSVKADADGSWSFTPDALDDGDHAFSTTVTDAAGNTGDASAVVHITIDTSTVSVSITKLVDNVGAITGDIKANDITDDARPEVIGKGKADSIINLYDGETLLGSTTTDAQGNWSFTPAADLSEGEHSITATATDKAGNVSEPTSAFIFTVDTLAPTMPTIESAEDNVGIITGPMSSGSHTDDATPTLSGKAEKDSTVSVYDGETLLGTVTADSNGQWTFTTDALAEGEHSFHVTATDKAGNVSEKSADFILTMDFTSPDSSLLAITGVNDAVGAYTGNVKSGETTDDSRPTISGTGTSGDTIIVYTKDSSGNHEIGRTSVDSEGKWSLQPATALKEGVNEFTAVEIDLVGNITDPSEKYSVTLDTSVPEVPVLESVNDNVGNITGNLNKGDFTDDNTPTFSGTGAKNGIVTLYNDGVNIGTATVDSDGKWSFTPATALADGEYKITVDTTNAVGQTSTKTDMFNFVVDTTAPGAVTDLTITDNEGAVTGALKDGDTTDDNTPTFSGKAEANGIVTLYDGNTVIGSVKADADGNWTFTPEALTDGTHAFSTTVTDAAGNTGEATPAINIIIDTTPLVATITRLEDNVGDVTGPIKANGFTDDTQPEIIGTSKAGSIIKVYDGATLLGSTTVDAEGNWSFTPATALSQGEHSITAKATDKTGNTSAATDAFMFTIDTVAPTKPTIESAEDNVGTITGPMSSGSYTDDSTPALSGKAEKDSTVNVYDGETLLGTTIADSNGQWTFTTDALTEGEHKFHVTATDKAGNVSDKSDDFVLTMDYTKPDESLLAITGVDDKVGLITGNVANGGATDDTRPTISGTGTKGDLITVYSKDSTGNHVIGSATVDADGKWSMQPATALTEGLNDLTAVEIDAAGNATDPSAKYSIKLDTAIPTTLAKITDITEDTGVSDKDFITKDKTLLIGGSLNGEVLPDNQKVQISLDNGASWHYATLSEDRMRWSYDNTSVDLMDGSYTFQARVVSESGVAGTTGSQVVVIDTTGPTNTTTVDLDPASDWGDYSDDNITGLATPTINGKVSAGSDSFSKLTVTLFDDKNNDGKLDAGDTVFQTGIKVNADGTWTTDLPSLQDGSYKLKGIVVDEAGNLQTSTAGKLIGAHGGTDDLVIKSNMRSALVGEKPGDNAGWMITNVGDFNGDGIDDFFVTAPNADTPSSNLGKSYLIYGTGAGLPNLTHLGALTPSQGLIITNTDTNYTQEGMVATNIGDWNGDGYDDIAVGSHVQDTMFIIYGGAQGTYTNGTLDMKTIMAGDNTHGFSISNRNPVTGHGVDAWMFYGITAADVDGDGYKDLIFNNNSGGTYSSGWHSGSVQIIYGGKTLADGSDWSNIYMKYLGTGGLEYGSYYVPTTDLTKETLTNNVRNTTVAFAGTDDNDMGSYMGSVGDVNGDGIEDFFMLGTDGRTHYLVYGKEGGYGQIMDLGKFRDGVDGVRFVTNDYDYLVDRWYGYHMVTRLGDINSDGIDDFAFGLPNSNVDRTVVVYGKQGGLGFQSIGLPSAANGAVPAGTKAFTAADGMIILNAGSSLTNWSKSSALFGAALAGGGDLNGDGIADFVIGAPKVTANGKSECGAIYVIYGQADNYLTGSPVVSINTLINDPSKGYVIYGEKAGEHLGQSITLGDWNGDGLLDIASSAPESNVYARNPDGSEDRTHGGNSSGAAYIYYSKVDFTKVYTTGDDILIADGKGIDGKPVDHDLILGGAGNDIILGISTGDFANGGAGNDTIHVASLDFLSVNGGSGIDTLVLDGNDLVLNLGALQAKVQNFEKFDLGSGHNTLTVKLDDVLRMGSEELAIKSGDKAIVVEGETGSTLKLEGAGQWAMTQSNYQHDGHTYNVWSMSTSGVEVLVEETVTPIIM
ncbi:Ig-like domain-containing protein [Jinshanibacter sp. LJY008]|uniref:Ig-like domain-containing protein n=1 Tax=Limnobaculum eriocheiris TaxID=2897391 RepID=A0A9X1MVU8_9GAMM|nr:Ig-like domain-containing protein [Limnobaculum eriocheiris]